MSTIWIICVLMCLSLPRIQSQWPVRQYVIAKDFFTGLKAGEFSVYDQSGNNLLYRLESRYAMTQTAELYAYPGKQLVASIRNIWLSWIYNADIQVYDTYFNQWISGRISQAFPGYHFRYIIQYANRRIMLERKAFSLTTEFRDEQQPNYLLARMRLRPVSIIWSNKYDLQVYTNDLPDVLFMLALIAYDYDNSASKRLDHTNRRNK